MGTGSSRSSTAGRAPSRRPSANGGGPSYPTPTQYYGRQPSNNGQLYGGFQQPQGPQYMYPQQYGTGPQQPRQQAPPQPPPTVERTTRTTTIRNHVNLKKNSLTVEPLDPSQPNKLRVKFTFDANLECWASVFFVASENPTEGCRLTLTGPGRTPPERVKFPQGLGQSYDSGAGAALDVSAFAAEALTTSTAHAYPVIVRLECIVGDASEEGGEEGGPRVLPEPAGASLLNWTQTQTTYATLMKKEEGGYSIQVVKQKIWVDGVSYELQEIFGIENCSTGMPLDDESNGKECVVCLAEARDTTVLPCRHMCMCSGCARMLRHQSNRCPICRTPVESLLEIKVAPKAADPEQHAAASIPAAAGDGGGGGDASASGGSGSGSATAGAGGTVGGALMSAPPV